MMVLGSLIDPQWEGQMPPAMSVAAPEIDWVYYAIFWFSVVFTVVITGLLVYFIIKYRRKKGDKLETPLDLTRLEIIWTVVPLFFIVLLFHVGFKGYVKNAVAAAGAIEIRAYARQWSWTFEHPTGKKEAGVLMLPVNKPVKIIMSSDDVIHSFYIPEFRVKKDAVPGMYSTVAFEPNKLGEAHVFCAEFCGTTHSGMIAQVKIVSEKEYEDYVSSTGIEGCPKDYPKTPCEAPILAKAGEALFVKNGCTACHSRDGSKSPGPTFKGLFGRKEKMMSGDSLDVDENYILESIRKPQAKIVDGYNTVIMPTFTLSDAEIDALIAYIKTIK